MRATTVNPGEGPVVTWWLRLRANAAATLRSLVRPPRPGAARLATLPASRVVLGTVIAVAAVAATMSIDARSIDAARHLPPWVVEFYGNITEFGETSWFLYPTGALLAVIALRSAWPLPNTVRLTLAALGVRLGFIFLAIAMPSLVVSIVKRLIGRARPLVTGENDPFIFLPLSWRVDYASLPSGHTTTAFSAAVAIGAIWPAARPLAWIYALMIAASRVALAAHHPSDVLAGAICGVAGALLVRNWFARRRLAFAVGTDGIVRLLPGPSWQRIKAVARRVLSA